jgi:hypothetical protein
MFFLAREAPDPGWRRMARPTTPEGGTRAHLVRWCCFHCSLFKDFLVLPCTSNHALLPLFSLRLALYEPARTRVYGSLTQRASR